MAITCSDIIKLVAAFFIPPLGVFLEKGKCDKGAQPSTLLYLKSADFWINVLLTLLVWVPGFIHAVYIIVKY